MTPSPWFLFTPIQSAYDHTGETLPPWSQRHWCVLVDCSVYPAVWTYRAMARTSNADEHLADRRLPGWRPLSEWAEFVPQIDVVEPDEAARWVALYVAREILGHGDKTRPDATWCEYVAPVAGCKNGLWESWTPGPDGRLVSPATRREAK